MIQHDDKGTLKLLDALRESLYKHAQAHRVEGPITPSERIPPDRLRHVLDHILSQKPPFLKTAYSNLLERVETIPRPFLDLKVKTVASYHLFGTTGIIAACIFPLLLAGLLNLSILITFILLLASAILTWAYIKVTILLTKKDAVVFFNYFLTLLAGSVLVLRIMNQPILLYMDIMILGAGLLFAFGRIGCFMAGCCYGKPSYLGIRYDKHHTKNGFPRLLRKVRLLPIQLIESMWLFAVTVFCTLLVFTSETPGITLSTFLILLALGRFVLEFFRGDPMRPYTLGLSQAQWTSSVMLSVTVLFQIVGFLPFRVWQPFILASFLILLITFIVRSKNVSLSSLYSASHVHEIAELFDVFKRGNLIPASTHKAIHIKKTSQNIQLSENRIPAPNTTVLHHITLSSIDSQLHYRHAVGLSKMIAGWYKSAGTQVVLPDHDNIYHLIHFTIDTR